MAKKGKKNRRQKAKLHVSCTSDGKWEARKPGAKRPSFVTLTAKEAMLRAKQTVRRQGGGEVTVHHKVLAPLDPTAGGPWPRSVLVYTPLAGGWTRDHWEIAREEALAELDRAFLEEWRRRFGRNYLRISEEVGMARTQLYKMAERAGFDLHGEEPGE